MNKFLKNSAITLVTEILVLVSGFATMVIIARMLGPEGKGLYSLIILIPGTIVVFSGFGIESANVYFTGNKKYKAGEAAFNSLAISIVFGVLLAIFFGFILGPDFFKRYVSLGAAPSFYILSAILLIPFLLFLGFFRNIIRGEERMKEYNISRSLDNLLQLALLIILAFVFHLRLAAAVYSFIFSIIFSAIFAFYFVYRKNEFIFSFNPRLIKDFFIYGIKVYLANIVSFLSYRFDIFLVAFFLDPLSVGLYSISVAIAERMLIMPGTLATVLFPRISACCDDEANRLTPKVSRHTVFFMIIASLAAFFIAKPFIAIFFGENFAPAVEPLLFLLPGIIAFGIGGVLAADLSGRGRPEFAIYSASTCLVSNIVLNIFLIPRFGINGAAISSSIAYWLDTLIIIFAFLKISKRPLSEFLIIKKEDLKDYYKIIRKYV